MTEDQARAAIEQAQEVLEQLGYKTYLAEVHVPTVLEQISGEGTDEEKQDAIDQAWNEVLFHIDQECNDFSERVDAQLPESDEDEDEDE